MTRTRAPLFGWGAFLLAAIVASVLGAGAQLAFAALAIGVLGLPHGASDLAVVVPSSRASFLVAYIGTIGAVLMLWSAAPGLGLAALLACSAAHFALDDEDQGPFGWARGLCLVGVPAILHQVTLANLFVKLTFGSGVAEGLAATLQIVGMAGLAIVVAVIVRRRASHAGDGITLAALAASVVLPPLAGFAVGFVMLHAWRQTFERQRDLHCATIGAYLLAVAPILAGSAVVLAGIAVVFSGGLAGNVGILFAGIAALAMPHMLVTPIWHRLEVPRPAAPARVALRL